MSKMTSVAAADLPAELVSALQNLLGPKGWRTDNDIRGEVSAPWRGTFRGHTPGVALPANTQEASALVKLCAKHNVAMTPQGGNTGLVDGGTPHGEITVSMRRMQAVRSVDPLNNSMTIEAGAPLVIAQHEAEAANRLFPLSLGSEGTASIGGLVSTNAGGVAVLRYGMMRDLILGLEVVLPNGDIWNGLSGLRKNNTGYDLKHLFAGGEGTLGLITAVTLKMFPRVARATAWISCETADDVVELLACVRDKAGDTVTSFEMIPANGIAMVRADIPDVRDPMASECEWRVLCEISMSKQAHAQEILEDALATGLELGFAQDAVIAGSLSQAADLWRIRESLPLSKRAYGTAVNHDVAVPVSNIPDFLTATQDAIHAIVPTAEIMAFGHVGDGNLHYSACESSDVEAPIVRSKADEITHIVHATALQFGGSISAEHGVGRLKCEELVERRSPAATELMKQIKSAIDPNGIMNPGRVVPHS